MFYKKVECFFWINFFNYLKFVQYLYCNCVFNSMNSINSRIQNMRVYIEEKVGVALILLLTLTFIFAIIPKRTGCQSHIRRFIYYFTSDSQKKCFPEKFQHPTIIYLFIIKKRNSMLINSRVVRFLCSSLVQWNFFLYNNRGKIFWWCILIFFFNIAKIKSQM